MTTDYRALCAELLSEIDSGRAAVLNTITAKLRTALSQPEPVVPTDEDLRQLKRWLAVGAGCDTVRLLPVDPPSTGPDVFVKLKDAEAAISAAFEAALAQPVPVEPTDEELLRIAASAIDPYESCGIAIGEYEAETESAVEAYGSELIAYARAVLQRWGSASFMPIPSGETTPMRTVEHDGRSYLVPEQPAAPSEEVERLTRGLRYMADNCDIASGFEGWGPMLIRSAELLQQGSAITTIPQPIPISERLPSDEDSDAHGRCWAWNPESLWWDYWRPKFIRMNAGDSYTHWLPGNALPRPTP